MSHFSAFFCENPHFKDLQVAKYCLCLEVLQQAAVLHELRDDEDGLLVGAHGVQLDQLGVAELLHDLSLAQEVLRVHRA